jgi:hypothetical protein
MLHSLFRRNLMLLALVLSVLAAALPLAAAQEEGDVVLRAGDRERTVAEFDTRFEIAIRALAARQGVQLNEQTRARLAPLAPRYLEQRALEVAWLEIADQRDLAPNETTVDEAVADVRGDASDEEVAQRLQQAGIPDVETLRRLVREGETIALLQQEVAADVAVSEDELREAYEGDPQRFGGEDAPSFEEAREELQTIVRRQKVQAEMQALAEEVGVETYPERLPYDTAAEAQDDASGEAGDGGGGETDDGASSD